MAGVGDSEDDDGKQPQGQYDDDDSEEEVVKRKHMFSLITVGRVYFIQADSPVCFAMLFCVVLCCAVLRCPVYALPLYDTWCDCTRMHSRTHSHTPAHKRTLRAR